MKAVARNINNTDPTCIHQQIGPGFCASFHLSFFFSHCHDPSYFLNLSSGVSACPRTGQFSNKVIIKQEKTALPNLATATLLVPDQSGTVSSA